MFIISIKQITGTIWRCVSDLTDIQQGTPGHFQPPASKVHEGQMQKFSQTTQYYINMDKVSLILDIPDNFGTII